VPLRHCAAEPLSLYAAAPLFILILNYQQLQLLSFFLVYCY